MWRDMNHICHDYVLLTMYERNTNHTLETAVLIVGRYHFVDETYRNEKMYQDVGKFGGLLCISYNAITSTAINETDGSLEKTQFESSQRQLDPYTLNLLCFVAINALVVLLNQEFYKQVSSIYCIPSKVSLLHRNTHWHGTRSVEPMFPPERRRTTALDLEVLSNGRLELRKFSILMYYEYLYHENIVLPKTTSSETIKD